MENVKVCHSPNYLGLPNRLATGGYYSMESDSERDPYPDTKHLIEQTLRFI
jgi:hypothetical protein